MLQDPQLTKHEGISLFYKDLLSSIAPAMVSRRIPGGLRQAKGDS